MADSDSEFNVQSNKVFSRHLSGSFFNVPGFSLCFSSRGSSDTESLRSPTSPLDFSFFSNITYPFSHKSPRSPSHGRKQKKWSCHKLGLGIINLLADESGASDRALGSPERKSIIFGLQVKGDDSMRSCSLPRNYIFSLPSHNKGPLPALGKSDAFSMSGEVPLEPDSLTNASSVGEKSKPILSSKAALSDNGSDTIASLPLVIGKGLGESLDLKPSSLPMPIGSCRGCASSLSARDIELSEDYTCIISHGPNPKTTHIFGDYILECPTNELPNFDSEGGPVVEFPQEANCPEGSNPTPCLSDDFLNFCSSCKKKLEKGDDIYTYRCRGEKAFCSFDCESEGIFSQEEVEKACDYSSKGSPCSSYHEDFFLVALDDQKL